MKKIVTAKITVVIILCCYWINNAVAQVDRFSKTFTYEADTLQRHDFTFSSFIYNPASTNLIIPFGSGTTPGQYLSQWRKLDLNGNELLSRVEIMPGTRNYQNRQVIFNIDNEFAYSGGSYQTIGNPFYKLFLQKIDNDLQRIWYREYEINYAFASVNGMLTIDSQYIMIFPTLSRPDSISPQFPKQDPFVRVMKMDTSGNILWHKVIDSLEWNSVLSVVKAHDGNLILCGRTWGYGVTDGAGFVMKMDTAGNKLWHRVYDLPGFDGLEKMIATSDGNYICVGGWGNPPEISTMTNGAGRVLKIDEQGDIIWDKLINDCPRDEWFRTVVQAGSADIIAFGGTYKYYASNQYGYEVGSTRGPEAWALRLDAQGNEIWNRVFGHNAVENCHDYLYNAISLPDGTFIVTGTTQIPDTVWENGNVYYMSKSASWIVRLDSNGCATESCGALNIKEPASAKAGYKLYPNPGIGTINISSTKPFNAEAQLIVTDQLGRIVQQQLIPKNIQQYTFSLNSQATGLYYILLQSGKENYSFKYILNSE